MSKAVSEFEKMNYLNEKPNVTNPMQSRVWPKGQIEGFIPVDGGRVRYHFYGQDKKGIPIIFLHGGPGGSGT